MKEENKGSKKLEKVNETKTKNVVSTKDKNEKKQGTKDTKKTSASIAKESSLSEMKKTKTTVAKKESISGAEKKRTSAVKKASSSKTKKASTSSPKKANTLNTKKSSATKEKKVVSKNSKVPSKVNEVSKKNSATSKRTKSSGDSKTKNKKETSNKTKKSTTAKTIRKTANKVDINKKINVSDKNGIDEEKELNKMIIEAFGTANEFNDTNNEIEIPENLSKTREEYGEKNVLKENNIQENTDVSDVQEMPLKDGFKNNYLKEKDTKGKVFFGMCLVASILIIVLSVFINMGNINLKENKIVAFLKQDKRTSYMYNNEAVNSREEKIENETIKTDLLTLEESEKTFNVLVEKTIDEVTINGEEKELTEDERKIAKIEIPGSQMETAEVLVKYKILIKNTGNVNGKVEIEETITKGFKLSEKNELVWTNKNGVLKRTEEIKAGEEKEVEIILKWKNEDVNLGTLENRVKLTRLENTENIVETTEEDNVSEAKVVISIKTGEDITGIYFILLILLILATLIIVYKVMYYKSLQNVEEKNIEDKLKENAQNGLIKIIEYIKKIKNKIKENVEIKIQILEYLLIFGQDFFLRLCT